MSERMLYTSTYSGNQDSACVEVGAPVGVELKVSSYSGGNGGAGVQIGEASDACMIVGDSKQGEEKQFIHASPEAFTAFTGGLAIAEFVGFDN